METTIQVVEKDVVTKEEQSLLELNELQLALIGGGIGDVIVG